MVSTYTDNLRITKQGDNDNPNTWGQIVNLQIVELLEEAISGVAVVDCTGSVDVNLATSVSNGATDNARHAVLELTGTIGANINLILPSVEKIYLIKANFSGAYTITVKPTGGSSGIVFNNSKKAIVYTKGTNITEMRSEVPDGTYGDIVVAGSTWTIGDNTITEDKLVDDSVTEDKIATGAVVNTSLNPSVITAQSSATAATDDTLLISDTSDGSLLKKTTVQNVLSNIPNSSELARGIIQVASLSETIAGLDPLKAVTPATLSGALAISKYYESSAALASGVNVFNHSLGTTPLIVYAELICVSPEGGYSAGDRIMLMHSLSSNLGGFVVWYNATQVGINHRVNSNTGCLITKTGDNIFAPTLSRWNVRVRAWA